MDSASISKAVYCVKRSFLLKDCLFAQYLQYFLLYLLCAIPGSNLVSPNINVSNAVQQISVFIQHSLDSWPITLKQNTGEQIWSLKLQSYNTLAPKTCWQEARSKLISQERLLVIKSSLILNENQINSQSEVLQPVSHSTLDDGQGVNIRWSVWALWKEPCVWALSSLKLFTILLFEIPMMSYDNWENLAW